MKKDNPCQWYSIWSSTRIKTGLCHNPDNTIYDAQISVHNEEHCQLESYCEGYME